MHIVMISDLETTGGAAIAASRLATGLFRAGNNVTRIVHEAGDNSHEWESRPLATSRSLSARVGRRMLPPRARGVLEKKLTKKNLHSALNSLQPDIINVHNLHRASHAGWDWEMVSVCAKHAPVVWTLHDMWSFTGRCAYSYSCRKFINGCDSSCPTPTEHPQLEPTRIAPAWRQRRDFFSAHPQLVAVTPSRWLAQEAKSGVWKGNRVMTIPYGVDLNVYQPVERAIAREALGIRLPGMVLFMAAEDLADRRKGAGLLVDALKDVHERPLVILTMGGGGDFPDMQGISWHHLGRVDHPRLITLAYNAADLFIHPAPVDNLPNVLLESMACGTPAVAFRIGGVPEIVRPIKTGWLADDITSTALAHALDAAIKDLRRGVNLRANCRELAETEYALSLQSQRYLTLYNELIEAKRSRNNAGIAKRSR